MPEQARRKARRRAQPVQARRARVQQLVQARRVPRREAELPGAAAPFRREASDSFERRVAARCSRMVRRPQRAETPPSAAAQRRAMPQRAAARPRSEPPWERSELLPVEARPQAKEMQQELRLEAALRLEEALQLEEEQPWVQPAQPRAARRSPRRATTSALPARARSASDIPRRSDAAA